MVGADRFDESAGERGGAGPTDARVRSLRPDADDDSYWSNIDYPEPRSRPAGAPPAVVAARRTLTQIWLGAFLAALLVVAGGAYALGRVNGHAPVPGLQRHVDAQRTLLAARAATIARQARALAADEAQLRSMRSQVSQTAATQAACRHAIAAADRAFGTESDALHALAGADDAIADTLTSRFGTELDEYADARFTCLGSSTSI